MLGNKTQPEFSGVVKVFDSHTLSPNNGAPQYAPILFLFWDILCSYMKALSLRDFTTAAILTSGLSLCHGRAFQNASVLVSTLMKFPG